MINVGLIGYGNWGKKIYDKLITFCEVKFICRKEDSYIKRLDEVDWVIVAAPDKTHYRIVKECIKYGKNVFCEKPLTFSYKKAKELFALSDKSKTKLYVDDIQNFRDVNIDLKKSNFITRQKKSSGSSKSMLYRFAYHDIYILYDYIKNSEIQEIIKLNTNNKLK